MDTGTLTTSMSLPFLPSAEEPWDSIWLGFLKVSLSPDSSGKDLSVIPPARIELTPRH